MNERIHRALDGEIDAAELSPAERAELAEYQAAIGASLRHAAGFEPPERDVSGRVMWRLGRLEVEHAGAVAARRRQPAAVVDAAARWLLTPRRFEVRPAALAASIVLLLAAGITASRALAPGASGVAPPDVATGAAGATSAAGGAPAADAPQRMLVQFRISAEGARQVALVGDFSGWQSGYALEQVAPGVWWTTVALEPGIYDYAFVVDGVTWKLDPLAPAVADGFGGANSRIAVLPPERVRRS